MGYFDYFIEIFEGLPDAFHDMLLDLHDEINNQVNPLSDDNISTWNGAVNDFKNDTPIGQVTTFTSTYGNTIKSSLSGANPTSHIYVNTIGVEFFGAQIPSTTIDIDMSWYGAYRSQCFTILRAFMIFGYFVLIIRNLPSLLGGVSPLIDTTSNSFNDVTIDSNGTVISATTNFTDGNNRYHIKR